MGNSGGLTGEELKQKLLKKINMWTGDVDKNVTVTKGIRIRSGSEKADKTKIGSLHIYYIMMNDEREALQQSRADARKGSVLDPNFGKSKSVSEALDDEKESAKDIAEQLDELADEMYSIVHRKMPEKGDECEDSQRICLLNALDELSSLINGISEKDFETDDE